VSRREGGPNAAQTTAFLNPFYIYAAMGSLTLILYMLGWSTIYDSLNPVLAVFLFATIAMSAVLGVLLQSRLGFAASITPQLDYSKAPKRITFLIVAGFLAEFAYLKDVPFFSNIVFHNGYDYGAYPGIPVFSVLLVTFSLFYATYLIDLFCQSGGRRKRSILIQFIVIQLMFLMIMSRQAILLSVIMASFLWLSAVKITGKRLRLAGAAAVAVMYGFGVLGNLRSGLFAFSDNSYIIRLSEVSESYPRQMPGQFLWTYMYTVSPIGNLNSLVAGVRPSFDFSALILNLAPDFVTKRYFPNFDPTTLVTVPYFNVSTGYAGAWKFYGSVGLWITYGALVFVCVVAARTARPMTRVSLAIACGIAVFMFFYNALSYSAVSFILIYPVIGSFFRVPRALYRADTNNAACPALRSVAQLDGPAVRKIDGESESFRVSRFRSRR
jgi:hypothetical protein